MTATRLRGVITAMLFLSYELGYWFNHWLSHKVPVLWEFHKVHHSATVLTPENTCSDVIPLAPFPPAGWWQKSPRRRAPPILPTPAAPPHWGE